MNNTIIVIIYFCHVPCLGPLISLSGGIIIIAVAVLRVGVLNHITCFGFNSTEESSTESTAITSEHKL